jgi:hypothetical protein
MEVPEDISARLERLAPPQHRLGMVHDAAR